MPCGTREVCEETSRVPGVQLARGTAPGSNRRVPGGTESGPAELAVIEHEHPHRRLSRDRRGARPVIEEGDPDEEVTRVEPSHVLAVSGTARRAGDADEATGGPHRPEGERSFSPR